ncbi:hypothetical protein H312_02545, partial [Anncaliia algerae PRA339]
IIYSDCWKSYSNIRTYFSDLILLLITLFLLLIHIPVNIQILLSAHGMVQKTIFHIY